MAKINVALCGIGGYAMLYTRYILDREDPRICPVGVVEPYPASCPRLADLEAAGIPVYATPEELYAAHQVDLTVIATPIQCHTPQILTALRNGSHVLCEKPLCADENDIAILQDASRKAGKFVFIGYQWSYAAATLALKRDIGEGRFGRCLEMKTIVLWPRDLAYYRRGSGWAGKVAAADGALIYDSIANNATAHYLHNMLFVLGEDGKAAMPDTIRGVLLRANDIENFDTCKVDLTFPGGTKACYIASHAVDKTLNPTYHFRFEKADVYYSQTRNDLSVMVMPEDYTEYGEVIAVTADGKRISYGNPFTDEYAKLEAAISAAVRGDTVEYPCGIGAASVHTRVINRLQKHETVRNIAADRQVRTEERVYAEGLWADLIGCYKNPEESLGDWAEV
ncbi:MAG: Gfo/Idh/MocA family oxidoreductase [Ruminococcaceae bacterium]|nr:Gfo/Idh/MocA family oxidoreductase [Oscillospiraceae bacterium]